MGGDRRLAQGAADNAAAGRARSAAAQYLRAANYYSVATYAADGTGDTTLFAALAAIERLEIPY